MQKSSCTFSSDKLLWWTLCSQAISLLLSALSPRSPTPHCYAARRLWQASECISTVSYSILSAAAFVKPLSHPFLQTGQKIPSTDVDCRSIQNVGLFNICERKKNILQIYIFPYEAFWKYTADSAKLIQNRISCHTKNHFSVWAGRITWKLEII